MRKLALILLLAAPAAAKTYMDNKLTVTHDCGKDGDANVMGNDSAFTITGACDTITVTGNHNTVKIEAAKRVSVTGNENNVTVDATSEINATGNKNTVSWKKAQKGDKPAVNNTGTGNKVGKP
jgi:hypothetical protein